jgi:hypothetical protein
MTRANRTRQDKMAAPTPPGGKRTTLAREQQSMRRCRTRDEGLALIALGHAIEYLIDSQLARQQEPGGEAQREALTILMEANRSVYKQGTAVNQGTEFARPWEWLRRWFARGDAAKSQAQGVVLSH